MLGMNKEKRKPLSAVRGAPRGVPRQTEGRGEDAARITGIKFPDRGQARFPNCRCAHTPPPPPLLGGECRDEYLDRIAFYLRTALRA